ncbi:MAG: hypothetical protein OEZ36_02940, partial [Spirochaetota bacterium]|nr:hypothetical protein [Spirochaetota bacterium]
MSKLLKDTVTKWNKWFWIILSLAILIRLVILTEIPHALYHNDSASYTNQTHSLLTDGRGILNRRPLGYPLILASVISVAGDYLAVVIVQMLTGLAVAVILYHLFWKVYPNRTAALWLFGTLSL